MYVTEYAERQFCQIAVNARYICYGLRAGQVRVLHKDTASRALLRGHTAQIADMRFSPATNADILASFGVDGNLFVKKIVSPAGGDGNIEEKALLQVTVTTDVAASGVALTPRVRWLSKTRIVASYGDGVFAVDVDPKASEAKTVALDLAAGADAPAGVAVIAPMAGKPAAVTGGRARRERQTGGRARGRHHARLVAECRERLGFTRIHAGFRVHALRRRARRAARLGALRLRGRVGGGRREQPRARDVVYP